jgi:multiple antibiotic resistance protein
LAAVVAGLLACLALTYASLIAASLLAKALGPTLVLLLSRLLGLLLAALSVSS